MDEDLQWPSSSGERAGSDGERVLPTTPLALQKLTGQLNYNPPQHGELASWRQQMRKQDISLQGWSLPRRALTLPKTFHINGRRRGRRQYASDSEGRHNKYL